MRPTCLATTLHRQATCSSADAYWQNDTWRSLGEVLTQWCSDCDMPGTAQPGHLVMRVHIRKAGGAPEGGWGLGLGAGFKG